MTKVFTLVSSLLFFSFTQTIGQPNSVTVGSTTLDVRVVIKAQIQLTELIFLGRFSGGQTTISG